VRASAVWTAGRCAAVGSSPSGTRSELRRAWRSTRVQRPEAVASAVRVSISSSHGALLAARSSRTNSAAAGSSSRRVWSISSPVRAKSCTVACTSRVGRPVGRCGARWCRQRCHSRRGVSAAGRLMRPCRRWPWGDAAPSGGAPAVASRRASVVGASSERGVSGVSGSGCGGGGGSTCSSVGGLGAGAGRSAPSQSSSASSSGVASGASRSSAASGWSAGSVTLRAPRCPGWRRRWRRRCASTSRRASGRRGR
jgi:hypothetical protein